MRIISSILRHFFCVFYFKFHLAKASTPQSTSAKTRPQTPKELKDLDKKLTNKIVAAEPKRGPKRTRGSISNESNSSPSTTPPPILGTKRQRRI